MSSLKHYSNLLKDRLISLVPGLQKTGTERKKEFNRIWSQRVTHYRLDVKKDQQTVRKLFEKTATYWRNAGFDEKEVYFSVLSADRYRKKLDDDAIREFYRSGDGFIRFTLDALAEYGYENWNDYQVLDFGSGVGRLSFHASRSFARVYAVDFSQGHLDLMQKNMERFPELHSNNVYPVLLEQLTDVEKLPKNLDLVYSYISLQHNSPPVMGYMIQSLLGLLKPGGAAFLHMPIHHPFYDFDTDRYLAEESSGHQMEMHMMPRETLRTLVKEAGCRILDSYGYGGTKGVYSEVFLIQRQ